MPSDCIFCKIVKGEIPCYKIYDDKDFLAFLDNSPANKGHVLLVPKEHYKDIFEIPDEKLSKMIIVVKKILKAFGKAGIGEGYNIVQNNGKEAGQLVFHLHFHLVPRIKGDKIFHIHRIEKPSEQEMKRIAGKIQNSL